jgi:hypothetical protein
VKKVSTGKKSENKQTHMQDRSKRHRAARDEEELEKERLQQRMRATNDELEHREMSFEERQQLSISINRLTSRNLRQVPKIITTNMPQFQLDLYGDWVEVDLMMLNNKTLWELHEFVNTCKQRSMKRNQKKHWRCMLG